MAITSEPEASTTRRVVIEVGVVVVLTAFVVWRLRPGLLFANTLPAGGDLSSHGWGPDFLARSLLPNLGGWSWDWFAGFPAFRFYPVLPALVTVALDQVLAYGVAMKLTIVAGVVTLPAASWGFARCWRLPFPIPPLVAAAAVAFLFDDGNDFGWNLRSTVAGEHSHALGMTIGVIALGVLAFVVRDGRWRATGAILLAAAMCSHPLALVFVSVGVGAIVAVHVDRRWRTLLGRVAPVYGVAVALAGVWWVPFLAWHGYMTSPDLPRGVGVANLATYGLLDVAVLALAVTGVVIGWRAGHRIVGALALVGLVHALAYLVVPEGQLENLRVVPAFLWCRLALAAIGVGEISLALARRRRAGRRTDRVLAAVPIVAALVVLLAVSAVWRTPPFGDAGDGFQDASIEVAFAGYQRNPQYGDYRALMDAMATLGRERGCGRFAWTTDVATTDFGTVSNDMAPFWTDGCIASMAGLYYDSSATTPMVSLTESLLGIRPMRFAPDVPYRGFDMAEGVRHLQYLGVRYFAARTGPVVAAAEQEPALRRMVTAGPWVVFEVADSALVTALAREPYVYAVPDVPWRVGSLGYTETAPDWDGTVLTATGPDEWLRIEGPALPAPRDLGAVRVRDVRTGSDSLSFRVNRTGVPVLVKASYFPTWSVRGADGPYRAAGNLMVVVPTERSVELVQTRHLVDWLASLSLAVGIGGLGVLVVVDRRRRVDGGPVG